MVALMKSLCLSFIVLASFATLFSVSDANRFNVGGDGAWVVNPHESYNTWAASRRFQVNDTLYFKYAKESDSVQQVTNADYDACNVKNPIEKFDNGETEVALNRSGPFYFISGDQEHCTKGQKMIVFVLGNKNQPKVPVSPVAPAKSPSPAQPPKAHSPVSPVAPAKPPSKADSPKAHSPVSPAKPPSMTQPPMAHSPVSPAKPPSMTQPPKAHSPVSPAKPPSMTQPPMAHSPVSPVAPAKAPSASPPPKSSVSPAKSPATSPATHLPPSKSPSPSNTPKSPPSPPKSPSPAVPAKPPTSPPATPADSSPAPSKSTPPADNNMAPAPSPKSAATVVTVNSVMATLFGVAFTVLMFA